MKKLSTVDILLVPLYLTIIVAVLFGSDSQVPIFSAWSSASEIIMVVYAIGYAVYSLRDIKQVGHAKSKGIAIAMLLVLSALDFVNSYTFNNSVSLVMAIVLAVDALYKQK